MTKESKPVNTKEIDAPDEDTILRIKLKQIGWLAGAVVGLLILLTTAYGIYANMNNRLENMEASQKAYEDSIAGKLPDIVEDAVKEKLRRESTVKTLLSEYTCEELKERINEIVMIRDLKNCSP